MNLTPDFSLPTIPLHLPWWAMMAIAVLGLGALALAGSVLMAGRKMELSRNSMLSFAQVLLWVVPAVVVVALIGRSTQQPGALVPEEPEPAAAATAPKADLIRSRTTSSEVPAFARPAPEDEKRQSVVRLASGTVVRRVPENTPDVVSLAFSSGLFAKEDQAAADLTPTIQSAVQEKLQSGFPIKGDFTVPVKLIDQFGVKESVLQTQDVEIKDGEKEKMVTLHVNVQITPELRTAVTNDWKGQIVTQRLTKYGSAVAVVSTIAALIAGYLGLNELTKGRYLWRLRLAALAGLAAAAVMGLQTLV